MTDRTDIPSPKAPNFQQRVRETLMTYLGRQGSPLDRGLTLRDLIENGIVSIRDGFTLSPGSASGTLPLNPGSAVVDAYEPDLTPPPTPATLTATAAISHILIEHEAPIYRQGHGHLRTRLYGKIVNVGDPLPTFADATEVAQFSGTIYAFPSNPATTWRFWIKWETVDGVLSVNPAGGTNGVAATTGQDVARLLEALTGEITESQLYQNLGARINLIDGPDTLPGSMAARLAAEATARANAISQESSTRAQAILDEAAARGAADGNLQQQINLLAAAGSGDFSELLAAVQEEQTARIAGDAAEATARQTLAAQLRGDYTGTDPSALTTGLVYNERQARVSAEGAISSSVSALSATVTGNYNTLNAAITSEQTARANADSALSTTINSVSAVANAKNKTYYQTAAPASGMTAGDLWFDSDDGNKAYRYSGSAWVATDDTRIAANAAAITTEQTARANADSALSSSITTLTATVNSNTAAIQTEATTRATQTGNLFAQYTVKIDVAGHVSGYGLASTSNGATPTSQFGVRASQFFVAPPAVSQDTAPTANLYKGFVWIDTSVTPNVTKYYTGSAWTTTPQALPFIIQTAPTTINGVSVPAGVYMDTAFIRDGTITNAKIGNAAIDDAKIANLSASKITAGLIAVGQYIQSADYVAGSAGWRINGDGNAELSNAVVRGTVYASNGTFSGTVQAQTTILGGLATSYSAGAGFYGGLDAATYKWRVGNPTGARIQWTGTAIEVYDGSNQLTLSSGGIDYSKVTGTKPPADADKTSLNTAAGIANQGRFATLSQITAANVSTYIASAAIGTAYIANAAITQAKIGNAAVGSAQIADAAITTAKIGTAQIDTLRLAGRAVTFPQSAYTGGTINGNSELTLQTITVSSTGEPALLVFSAYIYCSTNEVLTFNLYRDGVLIYTAGGGANYYQQIGGQQVECGTVIDQPAAGTHTYTMTIGNSGTTAGLWGSSRCMTYLECKR